MLACGRPRAIQSLQAIAAPALDALDVDDTLALKIETLPVLPKDVRKLPDAAPGVGAVSELDDADDSRNTGPALKEASLLDERGALGLLELLGRVATVDLGLGRARVGRGIGRLAGKATLGGLLEGTLGGVLGLEALVLKGPNDFQSAPSCALNRWSARLPPDPDGQATTERSVRPRAGAWAAHSAATNLLLEMGLVGERHGVLNSPLARDWCLNARRKVAVEVSRGKLGRFRGWRRAWIPLPLYDGLLARRAPPLEIWETAKRVSTPLATTTPPSPSHHPPPPTSRSMAPGGKKRRSSPGPASDLPAKTVAVGEGAAPAPRAPVEGVSDAEGDDGVFDEEGGDSEGEVVDSADESDSDVDENDPDSQCHPNPLRAQTTSPCC